MRAALIMSVIIWGCIYLAACSFQVGVEWTGETKKDNRSYSGAKEVKRTPGMAD